MRAALAVAGVVVAVAAIGAAAAVLAAVAHLGFLLAYVFAAGAAL